MEKCSFKTDKRVVIIGDSKYTGGACFIGLDSLTKELGVAQISEFLRRLESDPDLLEQRLVCYIDDPLKCAAYRQKVCQYK